MSPNTTPVARSARPISVLGDGVERGELGSSSRRPVGRARGKRRFSLASSSWAAAGAPRGDSSAGRLTLLMAHLPFYFFLWLHHRFASRWPPHTTQTAVSGDSMRHPKARLARQIT